MKIIHTADWHLGQTLLGNTRTEEHKLFLDWLLSYSIQNQINGIIVAGDIFDVSNPSIEAIQLYHEFIAKCFQNHIFNIIIGGNHDSAARLNSNESIFSFLNTHIIGGEQNAKGKIIPIYNTDNQLECIICGVPFLRDFDVRKANEKESVNEQNEKFTEGVKNIYQNIIDEAITLYGDKIPKIGTGHLYVNGSSLSDKEDQSMHTIGTLGQIPSDLFPKEFNYIALGHIHKAQTFKNKNEQIVKYSGSPIFLSFSERNDFKEITILTIENQEINIAKVDIPIFRQLKRIVGNHEDIFDKLNQIEKNYPLPTWLEIIINKTTDFQELKKNLNAFFNENNNLVCLKYLVEIPKNKEENQIRSQFIAGTDNNPLENIQEIFIQKCKKELLDEANINTLVPLLESVIEKVKTK